MAEEAIRGAVREALESFPAPAADLRLVPLGSSDANLLVESVLVEELAARGYPVEIATPREVKAVLGEMESAQPAGGEAAGPARGAAAGNAGSAGPEAEDPAGAAESAPPADEAAAEETPADPGTAEGAATDTSVASELATALEEQHRQPAGLAAQLRAARDSMAAVEGESAPGTASTPAGSTDEPVSDLEADLLADRATFSYRVTDFEFRYADIYRKMFVGPKRIRRLARVDLHMRLTEEGGRRVTWSKNVQHSASDVISYGEASHLESTTYAFAKPERSPSFMTRLYEPLVVGAIVGGLVFLFYSNQSGD
jgi:hypothetical protein